MARTRKTTSGTQSAATDKTEAGATEDNIVEDEKAVTPTETAEPEAVALEEPAAGADEAAKEMPTDEPALAATIGDGPSGSVDPAPRKGGFLSLALGGAVAAGLGFGAAGLVLPQYLGGSDVTAALADLDGKLATMSTEVTALGAEVGALKNAPSDTPTAADMTELAGRTEQGLSAVRAEIEAIAPRLDAMQASIGDMETRLEALEKRPVAEGAASATALEAFDREMAQFRTEIEAQRTDAEAARSGIAKAAADAEAKIAAAEAEAQRIQSEASTTARQVAARAAVSRLEAAFDSGVPLEKGFADLEAAGVSVPDALAAQAQGVPTLAALRSSFPPAARDALSASLRDTAGDGTWDRITAFLKSQSGARSLSPRAGDDPDAVLSRAEAALRTGDLGATLTEIGNLPPAGQARMAEWVRLAQNRITVSQGLSDIAKGLE